MRFDLRQFAPTGRFLLPSRHRLGAVGADGIIRRRCVRKDRLPRPDPERGQPLPVEQVGGGFYAQRLRRSPAESETGLPVRRPAQTRIGHRELQWQHGQEDLRARHAAQRVGGGHGIQPSVARLHIGQRQVGVPVPESLPIECESLALSAHLKSICAGGDRRPSADQATESSS